MKRLWLERGGALVLACARGGGELGYGWHVVGPQRQYTYDDVVAIAQDLLARKVTSPQHMGVFGLSAGGLLAGVMFTQHPELFHAAILQVPYLDQFRPDLLGGGAIPQVIEYGSLNDPVARAFLERTSPFQNVGTRPGLGVPLILTTTTDDAVHPAQARRFAEKMSRVNLPFLYYEAPEGGHNMWSTQEQHALYDAIFFTYLQDTLM